MAPSDIDPDSACRLPIVKREDLDEAGKQVFDHHVAPGTDSLAGLKGPGGVRLHSPTLSALLRPVARYLRFETGFGNNLREVAILITARETNCRFEWAAHEPEGLKQGVSQETIDVIKYRKPTDGLPEEEAAIIDLAREAMGSDQVSGPTYERAFALFGAKGLVDLLGIMGNYMATATLLKTFANQPPEGAPELPLP
jgi:4-carboxymuconolactone decarboxylase